MAELRGGVRRGSRGERRNHAQALTVPETNTPAHAVNVGGLLSGMITAHAVNVVTIPLPWGPIYRYITAHAVNVVIIPTY